MNNMQTVLAPDLLPWQEIVFEAVTQGSEKYITCVTSRQIGKSTIASVLILNYAINHSESNIGVVSLSFRQVKILYNILDNLLKQTAIYKRSSQSTMDIELLNGTRINFLTAQNPEGSRGFTFDYLFLDEAAYFPENYFGQVLQPTLLVKGKKCVLFSTPKGENYFYQLYKLGLEDNPMYRSFSFDYTHSPYLDIEEIEQIKKTISDELFQVEYECKFSSSASVFKNLSNVCVMSNFKEGPTQNMNYYMGIDLAINSDWSVATIMNQEGEVEYIYRERTGSVKTLEADLIALIKKWKPLRVTVESNNIGKAVIETLWQHFPSSQIQAFTTTNATKMEIIHELIKSIEEMSIKLPTRQFYPTLYNEMMDFTFKFSTATKALQYQARPGMHDDAVISLALTNHTWRKHNIPKRKMGALAHRFVR